MEFLFRIIYCGNGRKTVWVIVPLVLHERPLDKRNSSNQNKNKRNLIPHVPEYTQCLKSVPVLFDLFDLTNLKYWTQCICTVYVQRCLKHQVQYFRYRLFKPSSTHQIKYLYFYPIYFLRNGHVFSCNCQHVKAVRPDPARRAKTETAGHWSVQWALVELAAVWLIPASCSQAATE